MDDIEARDDRADIAALRALFDEAMDVPAASRAIWVSTNVPDARLRARLERLIAADASGGALDTAAAQRAERLDLSADVPASDLVGQTFAGFKLIRLLGQGGMATVFLAEREAADFRQLAAVKLLRRGLYSELEQRLFRRERRALAALSHPNIARLIDGGVTPAGIPFLVLEYIDGVPITHYATARGLDIRERLRLLVDVCRAVAAAHRALIVHRDIKPSNILVDADGEVKLLDFGVAKLLDEGETGDEKSRTAQRILTPGYAAPEQFFGGEITTATDVYALGVVLHELLLGARPDAVNTRRPSDQLPVRHADAVALESMSPTRLRAALRGDLDNVLLKALSDESALRYPDAAAFADDLERFLESRPVLAHPPSRWYRARKFVHRHRGGVIVTALLLLGMIGGLALALWQADVARQQANRAKEVQAFMEAMFTPVEQGRAMSQAPTVHELIERGTERIEQAYPDDPEVRADLMALFARINNAMGSFERNRKIAAAAAAANAEAYGDRDPRSIDARLDYGTVLRQLGEYDAAMIEYGAVRERLRTDGVHGRDLARVLDLISIVRMEQGMPGTEAIALKLEALREREADPASTPEELSTGYNNLGVAHQFAGEFPAALEWYGKALAINRRVRPLSRSTGLSLLNIGMVQGYQGRWREAYGTLTEGREMFARIPLASHPTLASLLTQLCTVGAELERFGEADASCNDAVAMTEAIRGREHATYIYAVTRRAQAAYAAGRYADGDADIARARAANAVTGSDRDYNELIISASEARRLHAQGDYAALRDAMLHMLDGSQAASNPNRRGNSPGEMIYSALAALACDHAPAAACASHDVAHARALIDSPRFARSAQRLAAHNALAEIALRHGNPGEAVAELASMDKFVDELGAGHSQFARAHQLLATAYDALGDLAQAEAHRTEMRRIADGLPATHPLRNSSKPTANL